MLSTLSTSSFAAVSDLFHRVSGIRLTPAKHALVAGRLQRLAQECDGLDLETYVQRLLRGEDEAELTRVVDRLTTNETYFFREPEHFDILAREAAARRVSTLRVWSAASSSGEEAYSIAMTLAECAAAPKWEIVGTDLSTAMVETARTGLYPMERAQNVSLDLLRRHCLKGEGHYAGRLLISRDLRRNVRFECANLTQPLPDIGQFDLVSAGQGTQVNNPAPPLEIDLEIKHQM